MIGAEQQLAADVAGDRALDQVRVVVGAGAVAVGHRAPHQRPDLAGRTAACTPTARTRARGRRSRWRLPWRARRRTTRACCASLATLLLDALQRRLALLDQFQMDAVVVQFVLEARDRLVGFVDDVRQVVGERAHLIGDRVGKQEADAGQREEECEVHGEHRQPAGQARALQEGDGRVEDQRDEPGDDEDQPALFPPLSPAPTAPAARAAAAPAAPSAGRPRAVAPAPGPARAPASRCSSLLRRRRPG